MHNGALRDINGCFASRVLNVQLLNLFQRQYTLTLLAVKLSLLRPAVILLHPCCRPTSPLPNQWSWRSNFPLSAQPRRQPTSPSGHLPPILLVVKLSPLSSVVILRPCCQPTSPIPTPSGHPPPILLVVKLSPLRPAVIHHPCCRPISPLPNQWSWR